jgi:hypothetical protein
MLKVRPVGEMDGLSYSVVLLNKGGRGVFILLDAKR